MRATLAMCRARSPHALEVGGEVHGGDQDAQVGGHRLLPGDHLERALFEVLAQGVDLRVVRDHPLGPGQIAVQQRVGSALHCGADELGHRDERGADVVELVVVNVTHCGRLQWCDANCSFFPRAPVVGT